MLHYIICLCIDQTRAKEKLEHCRTWILHYVDRFCETSPEAKKDVNQKDVYFVPFRSVSLIEFMSNPITDFLDFFDLCF